MSEAMLLIHSPLMGPSSWGRFGTAVRLRDHEAAIPDLTGVTDSNQPWWQKYVEVAVDAADVLSQPVVAVGHSGAGAFLPLIGEALGDRLARLVFVDAVIPPHQGLYETSADMRRMVSEKTSDGLLPKWLDWWPHEVVAGLLPDPSDRDALYGDMPQLPGQFYEEEIPVPESWPGYNCGYLRTSAAYDSELAIARRRGWPTSSLTGSHLSIFTEPDRVLDAVVNLRDQADG